MPSDLDQQLDLVKRPRKNILRDFSLVVFLVNSVLLVISIQNPSPGAILALVLSLFGLLGYIAAGLGKHRITESLVLGSLLIIVYIAPYVLSSGPILVVASFFIIITVFSKDSRYTALIFDHSSVGKLRITF